MLFILMEEAPKLEVLKSDATLGPLQKAMKMKEIGSENRCQGKADPESGTIPEVVGNTRSGKATDVAEGRNAEVIRVERNRLLNHDKR